MESLLEELGDEAFAAWAAIRLSGASSTWVSLYYRTTLLARAICTFGREGNNFTNIETVEFVSFVGRVTHFEICSMWGQKLFRSKVHKEYNVCAKDSVKFNRGSLVLRMD